MNEFTVYLIYLLYCWMRESRIFISIILLDESRISITRNASPLIFSRSFVDFSLRGDVTLYQTLLPFPPLLWRAICDLSILRCCKGYVFFLSLLCDTWMTGHWGFGDTIIPTGLQLPRLGCHQLLIPITTRVVHRSVISLEA